MQTKDQKRRTKNLIMAVVAEHEKLGQPISKMRLMMFLYLYDIEYYRKHRSMYTGFEWRNGPPRYSSPVTEKVSNGLST